MQQIGTIAALRRYPVKSMAGEDLTEARVTFAGFMGDRVYAFVDKGNRSDFPWLTGRQAHELILVQPRFADGLSINDEFPRNEQFTLEVRDPDGRRFRIGDDEFTRYLEERFGRPLRLRFSERSMTDSRPVSILGLSTIHALSSEMGINLDRRRFRENLYVDWADSRPFFEDSLVGKELQIGEAVLLQVVKKNVRCVMLTLDPETAKSSPNILDGVMRDHVGCVGVYGAVLREGIIRANDPIFAI